MFCPGLCQSLHWRNQWDHETVFQTWEELCRMVAVSTTSSALAIETPILSEELTPHFVQSEESSAIIYSVFLCLETIRSSGLSFYVNYSYFSFCFYETLQLEFRPSQVCILPSLFICLPAFNLILTMHMLKFHLRAWRVCFEVLFPTWVLPAYSQLTPESTSLRNVFCNTLSSTSPLSPEESRRVIESPGQFGEWHL